MDVSATPLLQLRPRELTSGVLCAVIVRQFGDTIRVQKEHVALPNLENIILAAVDIGRPKGFHSTTTTRDMAVASGLSMGAIYDYVESPEALLRMILTGVDYAVEHAFLPYDKGAQDDPALRLYGLIHHHIEVSDILPQSELHNERMMADAIADGIAKGIFIELPPLTHAGMIMQLLQDWYITPWKFLKRGMASAAYVGAVTSFVNRAIAPLQ